MLCPAPLFAFLGRVMRGEMILCRAPLLAFLGRVMRGEIDAVSSTLTRFSWTGYERGDKCCVQHPYLLFLDGL